MLSPRALFGRLLQFFLHRHVFEPHALDQVEAFGESHEATIERCACGATRTTTTARTLVAALAVLALAAPALAQVDDPSTPNKDESILSTIAPVDYQESPELHQALLAAAGQVQNLNAAGQPCAPAGPTCRVLENWGGMSNSRSYWQDVYSLLVNTTFKPVRSPYFKGLRVGQSGHTAMEWANCTNNAWTYAVQKANEDGGAALVQWGRFFMTQSFPDNYGTMSVTQLDAIVACQKQHFPNTRGVSFSTLPWTGQGRTGRAPDWAVANDDSLLATYAGLHQGIPIQYVQMRTNGHIPNPNTASLSFPLGLTTETADTVLDGVHPSTGGSAKMGLNYAERMRAAMDMTWYWWKDGVPPLVDPPPPPPDPAYGDLAGAQRKLLSGACSVVWGALEAPLPASWCSGL